VGLGPGEIVGERAGNLNAALAGTRTGTGTRSGIPAPAFFDGYPRTIRPRESPNLRFQVGRVTNTEGLEFISG